MLNYKNISIKTGKKVLLGLVLLFLVNLNAAEGNSADAEESKTINYASDTPEFLNPFDTLQEATGVDASADSFEIIGDNFIAEGNLKLRKGDMLLYADKGVINNTTKMAEVAGNVRMYSLVHLRKELEYWELERLESSPDVKLKIVGTTMTSAGRQLIVVDVIFKNISWSGEKAIGNLNTGVWQFGEFASQLGGGTFSCLGSSGIRYPDGRFEIDDAEVSSCPNLIEGHSVFSLKSAKVVAYPSHYTDRRERLINTNYSMYPSNKNSDVSGLYQDSDASGEYAAWCYNNLLCIGDIPVFWLPAFYKPRIGDLSNWTITGGYDSAWGYYANITNHWQIYDTDDVSLSLTNMLDVYSKRGIGVGAQALLETRDTKTEFFGYLIPDMSPGENYPDFSRFGQIPKWNVRYDVDVKNLTHLAENLDFRGRFAKLSDLYFLYSYFNNIALIDPQPATYANVSYNHEKFSLSLTARPRTNSFYSVIEDLPTLELNVPRQEIWKNFHYQSDSSVGYKLMKWRDFEVSRAEAGLWNGVDPSDYSSARFDTLHFAYYPVSLSWVNIIPRAGVRFTVYSNSSEQGISTNQLNNLLTVQGPEDRTNANIVNYDGRGGARARFIGELGGTITTKFHRNWSETKNAFWNLDGLRHVIQPYVDYTWIPKPTVNRDHLYYFDDIDRICSQNFIRIGAQNRLQTRRGGWTDSRVYTWASCETYVDVLFGDAADNNYYYDGGQENHGGIKNFADIGHKMTFNATDDLTFDFEILMDGQKLTSGFSLPWFINAIDKTSLTANYKLADGWNANVSWYAGSEGYSEGQYSMGSSFTRLQNGSVFLRRFAASNNLSGSLDFKINDRTAGTISTSYQFAQSLLPGATISISRQLPCNLELLLSATMRQQMDTSGAGSNLQCNLNCSLGFVSSPNYAIKPRDSLLPSSITRLTN